MSTIHALTATSPPVAGGPGPAPAAGFADALAAAGSTTGDATAPAVRTTLGGMLRAGGPPAAAGAAVSLGQLLGAGQAVAAPVAASRVSAAAFGGDVASRLEALGGLVRPVEGRVSSSFGPRVHPITGEHRAHSGVDVAAPTGTTVRSVAAGTVVRAEEAGGYGLLVEVDHGDGVTTRYAHLSAMDVRPGDVLAAGTPLGDVGSTGMSTGPHLHLELRIDGTAVDPGSLVG